jgi:hypothetical protein
MNKNLGRKRSEAKCKRIWGLERVDVRLRFLLGAGEKVDMVVVSGCAAKNHAMGVEGRGRDGRATVLLQEAGVRFHARQLLAIKIEDLDNVGRGTTTKY